MPRKSFGLIEIKMALGQLIQQLARAAARAIGTFARNLIAGARLCLPWRLGQHTIFAGLGQFVALLVGLWLLAAVDDRIDAGPSAEFSAWGILSQATQNYFWVASLGLIVLLDKRPSRFLQLGVSMASVTIVLFCAWIVVTHIGPKFAPDAYAAHYLRLWQGFLAWEVLVLLRILISVLHISWPHATAYAAGYGGLIYAMLTLLPHSAMFNETYAYPQQPQVDVEASYYAQTNLLRHRLHALAPQRQGVADIYFVGFAAYGRQDVFQREVEQATEIFEQQFDASGRSLKLINNPNTLAIQPLANRHNLEKTVRGIAAKMNLQEDVLTLFLSSHGAEDATISVNLPRFGLNDLSAMEIRSILDEHEIHWRIIIISACYSGSFIEPLRSPTTLIITAAAADRSSFGCAHENDWTYFGEAYFADALQHEASFIGAFKRAQQIIERREKEEGKTSSKPQISAGDEIAPYLAEKNL